MAMNPDTNHFESLHLDPLDVDEDAPFADKLAALSDQLETKLSERRDRLLRPDGTPVPEHWSVFTLGETVTIKGYMFRVAYLGETSMLWEPVGPAVVPPEARGR